MQRNGRRVYTNRRAFNRISAEMEAVERAKPNLEAITRYGRTVNPNDRGNVRSHFS